MHAKSYKTGGHSGPCALFKVESDGKIAGRRWDGGHGTRMSEITVSELSMISFASAEVPDSLW